MPSRPTISDLEPETPAGSERTGIAESEVRLRAILDHAIDGVITINDRGIIESLNPAALTLFGYRDDELLGANVNVLMPDPYQSEHDHYLKNYRTTGEKKIIGIGREVLGKRKDGSVFPVDLSVSEFRLGDRRLFTGIVRDITERMRTEEERQKFVSLVENSSDFIAMASTDWRLLYINSAGQTLIGIDPDRVETMEVRDLWHEDTLPLVLEKALPAQSAGGSFRFTGRLKHAVTGEPIDVDCNTYGITDPQTDNVLAIAFSLRDIREQKQIEQDLRDSKARMKAILENAVDGIVTINEHGIIESINRSGETVFGYASEELIGENIRILMPEPYRGEHDQYLRNYRHTGERKIIGIGREVMGRRKDGTSFPIDLSVSEVPVGEGRLFTGLIRDITQRKQADEHRDLLIAELSHRVKNTLATVISIGQRSFHKDVTYASGRNSFEGRIRGLAQTHNRLAETKWSGADLRSVIEDELTPYRNSKTSNIRLAGPDVSLTPKGAISLGMAFHELATNAAKYGALSTEEGVVEVNWGIVEDEETLTLHWTESNGPEVLPPTRKGFGHLLLERGVPYDLHGSVELNFHPDGVTCDIAVPTEASVIFAR